MRKKMHSLEKPVDFNTYKQIFMNAINEVLLNSPERSLDEAAFPAYSHPNKIINEIYWTRLKIVFQEIKSIGNISQSLDYGCGSGILLPFLAHHSEHVIGLDIDINPSTKIQKIIAFPTNITIKDLNVEPLSTLPKNHFDLITALNVLEHIDRPQETVDTLIYALKPGGRIIVSLPKENFLYYIGRKIAGKEFTGDYHKSDYANIVEIFNKKGLIIDLAKGFPYSSIFKIFYLQKK